MEDSQELEKAYRRGFDQGFYFALDYSGWTNKQVQDLAFKKRLGNWRHGRKQYSLDRKQNAPKPTPEELKELQVFAKFIQLEIHKKGQNA